MCAGTDQFWKAGRQSVKFSGRQRAWYLNGRLSLSERQDYDVRNRRLGSSVSAIRNVVSRSSERRDLVPPEAISLFPRTPDQATKAQRCSSVFVIAVVGLFNWREALVIVKPETLIGWHRKGFKLVWRWKSRVGRPRLPERIRKLIVQMIEQNPTWGEERVAAELSVKLGILVSPRTIRAYWPPEPDRTRTKRTFPPRHRKAASPLSSPALSSVDGRLIATPALRMSSSSMPVCSTNCCRIRHCR